MTAPQTIPKVARYNRGTLLDTPLRGRQGTAIDLGEESPTSDLRHPWKHLHTPKGTSAWHSWMKDKVQWIVEACPVRKCWA